MSALAEIGVGGDRCLCGTRLPVSSAVSPAWVGPHLRGYFLCDRCGQLNPRIIATDDERGGLSTAAIENGLKRQREALAAFAICPRCTGAITESHWTCDCEQGLHHLSCCTEGAASLATLSELSSRPQEDTPRET